MDTFLQLHGKEVQLLHPFLQLVLSGGRHGVDVIVAAVVVLIGVGGEDLQTGGKGGGSRTHGLLSQNYLCIKNNFPKVECTFVTIN